LAISLLNDVNYTLMKTDVEEYTKLLCIVATVHHRSKSHDRATEAFKEATSLIQKHQFSDTTAVYNKWVDTKELLESPTE
jgi:hypothetical protein